MESSHSPNRGRDITSNNTKHVNTNYTTRNSTEIDGNSSVNSAGTDRASNHGIARINHVIHTPPVPSTVVAIDGGATDEPVGDSGGEMAAIGNEGVIHENTTMGASVSEDANAEVAAAEVKLTAEALAKNNRVWEKRTHTYTTVAHTGAYGSGQNHHQQQQKQLQYGLNNNNGVSNSIMSGGGLYNTCAGIVEMSSTLSRSSSESGLKELYRGAVANASGMTNNGNGDADAFPAMPSQVLVTEDSGAATPAHFQPWEASSVCSSLGDPFPPTVAMNASISGRAASGMDLGPRDLSETAVMAYQDPHMNNTKLANATNVAGIPVPPSANSTLGLLPTANVSVDSTIATTRPPAPPPPRSSYLSSPFPSSPRPPPAIRIHSNGTGSGGAMGSASPSVNLNKKATFQEPMALTRTSSNGSSTTTNTTNATVSRIRLGICAMDKKARSKPMSEILKRLDAQTFEPVFFGDDVILNEPVENWPECDVLIAFYSNGYPLEKAEKYHSLRKPYLLNDLKMQRILMDRRRVYDLLEESGIDVPRHVFMSRDGYVSTGTGDGRRPEGDGDNGGMDGNGCKEDPEIEEHDDHIEVNGVIINKPFVEKPVDADDHNIAIYYPSSAGGGCKKLFRKVGDRSSEFYPEINEIRRDGSYIYEEFIETQGTDVKMYTVGPDYGHAEARKSPAVDGKVERNPDGKEVRFPVILTLREKEIARRIVLVFKQQVCGFDILRIQEGDSLVSYVCDVNGWSFVKNSRKYYDDCATILTEHMLAAVKPKSKISFSALAPLLATMEDTVEDIYRGKMKKKRHNRGPSIADRVKSLLMGDNASNATNEEDEGLDLNASDAENNTLCEVPEDFKPVRDIVPNRLATEPASIVPSGASSLAETDDDVQSRSGDLMVKTTHQEELRCVLTVIRHGDRTPKQKLKGDITEERFLKYFHDHTDDVKKDLKVKAKKPMVEFLECVKAVIKDKEQEGAKKNREVLYKVRHIRDILQRWKFSGLNRKLQMKPRKWVEEDNADGNVTKCSELQLVVKWGGDLTKLGEKQAINLGKRLRNELYPDAPGGGILRLHSTFRHDLKIKTSDEGRVMKTAAAFAKGMLELEGEIPPILVSLVHKEKDSQHMLDPSGNKEVKKDLAACKKKININMQKDADYDKMTEAERESLVGPARLTSLHRALKEIGNPRKTLFAIHSTIGKLVEELDDMLGVLVSGDEDVIEGGAGLKGEEDDEALSGIKLYKGETLLELTERWKLLQNKLYDEEKDMFDLSRVPDVHDNVRFDMLHNPHLGLTETLQKLYDLAKSMADCVVPQEYGITTEEKRDIGNKMCGTLLEKINYDLAIARTDNQVDMRYLINMDYSSDLPINSMGRRVRSRLYFTSESHLHTLLNVLRFPSSKEDSVPSPLSKKGQEILANASELCYLTQVVIRLFEDTQKPSDDPKRFRVEIWFSPGATATPLHMAELQRESDATRFDTEKLQKISIDGLTCEQVEKYFTESIKEGKTKRENSESETSSDSNELKKKKKDKNDKSPNVDKVETKKDVTFADPPASSEMPSGENSAVDDASGPAECVKIDESADSGIKVVNDEVGNAREETETAPCRIKVDNSAAEEDINPSHDYWRAAALFGVLLGAGILLSKASKAFIRGSRP